MEAWTPFILAVISAIPGIIALILGRKKADAEASSIHAKISSEYAKRVDELEAKIEKLRNEYEIKIDKLEAENAQLRMELESANQRIKQLERGTGNLDK